MDVVNELWIIADAAGDGSYTYHGQHCERKKTVLKGPGEPLSL